MDEEEREIVEEVFDSVRPYLTYPDQTREVIDSISDGSSSIEEFKEELESRVSKEKDPTTGADYRIFINKLTSR